MWLLPDRTGGDLRLSDYKNIWTKFLFLDESGTLDNPTTAFFTIGVLKCAEPYYLGSKLVYERNRVHFYDELKFNKLSGKNIEFAKFAVGAFFETKNQHFYSYTLDKEGEYFKKTYPTDPWQAYEDISIRLLTSAIASNEVAVVIADHVLTPKHIRYEVSVKKRINDEARRLAIAGVCRFNSKANDLLQVTDLLIGAINYDLKRSLGMLSGKGDKHKIELADFIKEKLGVSDFLNGHRTSMFNIFVDKDILARRPV